LENEAIACSFYESHNRKGWPRWAMLLSLVVDQFTVSKMKNKGAICNSWFYPVYATICKKI